MPNWRHILIQLANSAEGRLDTRKRAQDQRWGAKPICIAAYHGYGASDCLFLQGRMLEDRGIRPAKESYSAWRNLRHMYRCYDSDKIPGARVLARCGGVEQLVVTDEEGFFEVRLVPDAPLPLDRLWHTIELTLVEPQPAAQGEVCVSGWVLVPPRSQFGVISDIDDTVIRTDTTSMLRMLRATFETLIIQVATPALHFSMLYLRMFDAQMRREYGLTHAYLEQRHHLAMTHDYFGMSKEAVEDDLRWDLAVLLFAERDYQQALPRIRLSYARAIQRGNMYKSTAIARGLGYALLNTGDIREAAERFRESLLGNFALGNKQAVAACLAAWAALAMKQEDYHRAARLFGASEVLQAAISTSLQPLDVGQVQQNLATLRQVLPAPDLKTHWAAGRAMSLEQAIDGALAEDPYEQQ